MNRTSTDYYKELELDNKCSLADIKSSYKKLALVLFNLYILEMAS